MNTVANTGTPFAPRRIAVILSGCGVYDGSEIHEAVAVLYHLSVYGATAKCFAPDKPQMHVVNHLTGKPASDESRNVLVESARIARGDIQPLSELRAEDFDAVVLPGGFGAAKNLCDFATKGSDMHVDPQIEGVLRAFHAARKPIGACCIAPVIPARVFANSAVGVTIGNDTQTAQAIESWGARHLDRPVTQMALDTDNRVVTAPAYMYGDAPIRHVFEGIGRMIETILTQTQIN
ncbi:MAG: isoprenoid biosynthesis glyoxalase ElbB [Phycisphaeraceae bacterium]|nr:isoprenoid biosynthesis glyoxalase ElbB [Phycisphaeraceae bacterium]